MWSFLTQRRPAPRTRKSTRTRLSLEPLEHRDCPSGVTIDSFVVEPTGAGTQVELYGTTLDAGPGTNISFSGAASGSVAVDDWGMFDTYVNSSQIGTVYAHADGNAGNDFVTCDIGVTRPIVSPLTVVYGSQKDRTVTISGSVVAPFMQTPKTVTFSGVVTGSTSTDGNGNFVLRANASGPGNVNVTAIDAWGQNSDPSTQYLNGIVPVISGFQVTKNGAGQWVASGTVTGGIVSGMTVNFGGSSYVIGTSATVNGNTFSVVLNLPANFHGTISASTTNGWGQTSNTALFLL